MVYASTHDGSYGAKDSVTVIDSTGAPDRAVLVPDTEFLFTAQFHRAGPDLVLHGHDGREFLITGYFASEHPPALVAPNGARLSGATVDILAGSPTPGHYAQAAATAPHDAIGKVEKVVGDVIVVRNGVAVGLHVGDAVFKSDVVQTGASASCGISFPDGTALNLVANTRMALNEYSFDANSNGNGALFTLVEGTFAFVAGKVAHQGDMKISTPVATMGIRGTTGIIEKASAPLNLPGGAPPPPPPDGLPPGLVTSDALNSTYSFAVVPDFGTGVTGFFDLIMLDVNGNPALDANGRPVVFHTVSQNGYVSFVTLQAPGQSPLVTTEPVTNAQFLAEQQMLKDLFETLNPNSQQNNGNNGSSTPSPLPGFNSNPQFQEDSTPQLTNNNPDNNNSSNGPTIQTTALTNRGLAAVEVWGGGDGSWAGSNWLPDLGPPLPVQGALIGSGKATLSVATSVQTLEVDGTGILNIVDGGALTVLNVIKGSGTIQLNSSGADPTLAIGGNMTLTGGGTIKMLGVAADNKIIDASSGTLINEDWTITGTGTIGAGDKNLTFENFGTVNATGLLIVNTGNQVTNGSGGLMEATAGGTLQVEDSVFNDVGATVKADGAGSVAAFSGAAFDNFSIVTATNSGAVTFTGVAVTNEAGATISADDGTVTIDLGSVANSSSLQAVNGGILQFESVTVTNAGAAEVSIDATSKLNLDGSSILHGIFDNAGLVTAMADQSTSAATSPITVRSRRATVAVCLSRARSTTRLGR